MQRLYGLGTGGFAINLHGHFFSFPAKFDYLLIDILIDIDIHT